ncbi:odorant-binding protein 59a [Colletes latitarsis]|uniref:odorant-binding protein 59a n=1 Tax=Colletes latitarsis TaxID=2605962 RepID=UPI0040355ADF
MTNFFPLALCCIILFFLNEGISLRCRSENQEVDMQFQKVLKTCKKRYSGSNTDSEDSMSSESDLSSEEDVNDNNFFSTKMNKSPYNQSTNTQRYRTSEGNSNIKTYSFDHLTNKNVRDFPNSKNIRNTNDRNSWNSTNRHNKKDEFYNEDTRYTNNTGQEQSCIVQCFFNELNVVDQKGFPERDSVIPLMSLNIQDPELKDFVEESIIECFRYLESNKREKCEFSQNLLKCLAEKGHERCEDWEN